MDDEHVADHFRVPLPVIFGVGRAVYADIAIAGAHEALERGRLRKQRHIELGELKGLRRGLLCEAGHGQQAPESRGKDRPIAGYRLQQQTTVCWIVRKLTACLSVQVG
jgi:hypothetical protein